MIGRFFRKMSTRIAGGFPSDEKKTGLEIRPDGGREFRTGTEAIRTALAALKIPEETEDMDFTEEEWRAAIQKAVTRRPERQTIRRPAVGLRPVFASGLAVILIGAAILFGIRRFPWLVPTVENQPGAESGATASNKPEIIRPIDPLIDPAALYARVNNAPSSEQAAGDVPTLTWISQETGLHIVWFVNDNIDMED